MPSQRLPCSFNHLPRFSCSSGSCPLYACFLAVAASSTMTFRSHASFSVPVSFFSTTICIALFNVPCGPVGHAGSSGKNLPAFNFASLLFQHFQHFPAFPSISQHLAAKC